MATTFADKFEQALAEKKQADPNYGLRTVARILADGDKEKLEIIRRRLYKYRPPKPGAGGAKVVPTEPTRREIEKAMGLEQDALKPEVDENAAAAHALMGELAEMFGRTLERAVANHLTKETA